MLGRVGCPLPDGAKEHPPSIVVVDADPGLATGLTLELQHGFGREYQFLAGLSARSGLDILKRPGAAGEPVALVMAGLQLPDMPVEVVHGEATGLRLEGSSGSCCCGTAALPSPARS